MLGKSEISLLIVKLCLSFDLFIGINFAILRHHPNQNYHLSHLLYPSTDRHKCGDWQL